MDDLRRIVIYLSCGVLLLFSVLGVVVTVMYLDAQEQRENIAQQTQDFADLTQVLCDTFSNARTASNFTIREPIRTLLEVQAEVLMVASQSPANKGTPREPLYRARAKRLLKMVDRVRNVGPVDCQFNGEEVKGEGK